VVGFRRIKFFTNESQLRRARVEQGFAIYEMQQLGVPTEVLTVRIEPMISVVPKFFKRNG